MNDLKRQVSTISQLTQLPTKALLASPQIAHRIAKPEMPHTISEELRLIAANDLVCTMIEVAAQQLEGTVN